MKTREEEEGIVQHTDLQVNDQVLAVNCIQMERRMTVFKMNRLLHTLLGDIDLIVARGDYTLPEWTPQDEAAHQESENKNNNDDNTNLTTSKSFKSKSQNVSRSSSKRNLGDKNSTEMTDLSRANSLGRTPTSKRTDSVAGSIKTKLRKNKSKRGQSTKSRRSMSRGVSQNPSRKSSRRSTIRRQPTKDGVVKRRGRSVRSIASSILSVTTFRSSRMNSEDVDSGSYDSDDSYTSGSYTDDSSEDEEVAAPGQDEVEIGSKVGSKLGSKSKTTSKASASRANSKASRATSTKSSSQNNSTSKTTQLVKQSIKHPDKGKSKQMIAPAVNDIQNTDIQNTSYCLTCFKHVVPHKQQNASKLSKLFCCMKKPTLNSSNVLMLCPNCGSLI